MSKDNSNSKNKVSKEEALNYFLKRYLEPAFGSLSKTEIDILVLELLEQIGEIAENINQYSLSKKLKISQAKAKNLLYNRSLRKYEEEQLKKMFEEILLSPKYKIHKGEDGWFWFQIENPLLLEYVKNRIQQLEHIPDGSFSSKIIKLQADAFADLIEDCIGKEKNELLKRLGIPENNFKELLVGTVKEIAEQHITKSGVAFVETIFILLKSKIQAKDKK